MELATYTLRLPGNTKLLPFHFMEGLPSLERGAEPNFQHFRTKQRNERWGQERNNDVGRKLLKVSDVV